METGIVFGGRTMEKKILEEHVLRKVMKNIPFGLVVSKEGLRRKVYYVNQTAHELMGYTKEEYVKLVEKGWTGFVDVDLRKVIRENHRQIRTGEPFEVLSQARTKDGRNKWFLCRIVVRMQEGPLSYVSYMDVTERIEQEQLRIKEQETLREQAAKDSFTKLLNRGTMEQRVRDALEACPEQSEYGYIALDVDNFKQINDVYGHGAGDMLILALAELLTEVFGEECQIGRMGGDEFAVFIPEVESREMVFERAERVRRELHGEKAFLGFAGELHGEKASLGLAEEPSVSIGIAFGPESGKSFEELYRRADEALYKVKNEQKNGISVFEF